LLSGVYLMVRVVLGFSFPRVSGMTGPRIRISTTHNNKSPHITLKHGTTHGPR